METPNLPDNTMTAQIRKYQPTGRGFATGFGGERTHFGLIVDGGRVAYLKLTILGRTLVDYADGEFDEEGA